MLRRFSAVAALVCLGVASAPAAPVVLYYDYGTGNVEIFGLTGEIGFAFRAPEASLLKANAPNSSGTVVVDKGTEGEIAALNFGGFYGSFSLGKAAQPGLGRDQIGFFVQVNFMESIDYPPDSRSDPRPGQGGILYRLVIPEPTTIGPAGVGLVGLMGPGLRRRRP